MIHSNLRLKIIFSVLFLMQREGSSIVSEGPRCSLRSRKVHILYLISFTFEYIFMHIQTQATHLFVDLQLDVFIINNYCRNYMSKTKQVVLWSIAPSFLLSMWCKILMGIFWYYLLSTPHRLSHQKISVSHVTVEPTTKI